MWKFFLYPHDIFKSFYITFIVELNNVIKERLTYCTLLLKNKIIIAKYLRLKDF